MHRYRYGFVTCYRLSFILEVYFHRGTIHEWQPLMWTEVECRALILFEKSVLHFAIVFEDAWEREFLGADRGSSSLQVVTDATIASGYFTNRSNM